MENLSIEHTLWDKMGGPGFVPVYIGVYWDGFYIGKVSSNIVPGPLCL